MSNTMPNFWHTYCKCYGMIYEPSNSKEISYVISIRRPDVDLGISKKELVEELKDYGFDSRDPYKRIKELNEWTSTQYTGDWFRDVIALPDEKRQFGNKKYRNIFS